MAGFLTNIEKKTLENENYREVLYTDARFQLVVMSLKPGEEIGSEVHEDHDQFIRFEMGMGKIVLGDTEYEVEDGSAMIVPAGTRHNVINTSKATDLKLYTIYTPPEHKPGTIHETKADSTEEEGH